MAKSGKSACARCGPAVSYAGVVWPACAWRARTSSLAQGAAKGERVQDWSYSATVSTVHGEKWEKCMCAVWSCRVVRRCSVARMCLARSNELASARCGEGRACAGLVVQCDSFHRTWRKVGKVHVRGVVLPCRTQV